jgi:hypothetical protein
MVDGVVNCLKTCLPHAAGALYHCTCSRHGKGQNLEIMHAFPDFIPFHLCIHCHITLYRVFSLRYSFDRCIKH